MYPVLFEFGVITVFSLWFFIAVGFVAASLLFVRLAKRNRVRLGLLADHSLTLFFSALILSRVAFIAQNTDLYFYNFSIRSVFSVFAIWDKGLSFWGAVVGFVIALAVIARQNRESLSKIWDMLVPAALVGMVCGDFGALLDGINYGKPTDLPWGIVFRSASVKYISAVHPTEIYAMIYTLAVVVILLTLLKNLRGVASGFVSNAGVFLFSTFKFLEEFFRGDETIKLMSIRVPQILALMCALGSGYLLYKKYRELKMSGQIPLGVWSLLRPRGSLEE